jgi:hypothetical protein
MRTELFFSVAILLGSFLAADEVPKPLPDVISTQKKSTPQIVIPVVPILDEEQVPEEDYPAPAPKPNRGPVPVSSLSEDTWYVIESPVPLIVLHSPAEHVGVQPEEGPVKVRGKFADGTGKTETRTFSSKHLYFVNAVKAGQIELLIVPIGVSAETEVIRQPLAVMGLAPNPPPGPGPGPTPGPNPDPDPDPEPVPVADQVAVAVVHDATNIAPGTAIFLNGLVNWNAYVDAGNTWRIYDVADTTDKAKKAIEDAKDSTLPAVVVADKKTGKVLRSFPMPESFESFRRIMAELGVK